MDNWINIKFLAENYSSKCKKQTLQCYDRK